VKRFELTFLLGKPSILIGEYNEKTSKRMLKSMNTVFSQIASVNYTMDSLKKLNIIRLYLVKTYKGKCHALGKPVRGQRT
jgi:ribosomal protein S13